MGSGKRRGIHTYFGGFSKKVARCETLSLVRVLNRTKRTWNEWTTEGSTLWYRRKPPNFRSASGKCFGAENYWSGSLAKCSKPPLFQYFYIRLIYVAAICGGSYSYRVIDQTSYCSLIYELYKANQSSSYTCPFTYSLECWKMKPQFEHYRNCCSSRSSLTPKRSQRTR